MYGSRKKAKLALKKITSSHDDDSATTALTIVALANGVQHISSPPVSCLPPPPLQPDFEGLFTRYHTIMKALLFKLIVLSSN